MSDVIKEFIVSFGYAVDSAGMAKTEAATKQAEDRITAANAAALNERIAKEKATQAERIALLQASGKDLNAEDRRFVLDQEKARVDALTREKKRRESDVKDVREKRSTQFNELKSHLLQVTSVANALSAGVAGFLSVAPFGAFIGNVVKTAGAMSGLEIQAKRVGTSVQSIMRLRYALGQAGVSEGEADSSLEGFSRAYKVNPKGFVGMLKGLGVKTEDENGKPIDDVEKLYENVQPYLARLPYNLALNRAQQWGIGENALIAGRDQPNFNANLARADKKYENFGLDPIKASEDARKVDQAYTNLSDDLKIINTRLQAEFFVPVLNGFDAIAKKLEENPQAAANFGRGLEALAVLVSARVLPVLANLLVKFAGLKAVLGEGVGTALGIALNPVVVAGATAESTPGKGVSADPAERAKEAEQNKRDTDAANARLGQGNGFWSDVTDYFKKKLGFGGDVPVGDSRVKDAIIKTERSVTELKDLVKAQKDAAAGNTIGGVAASSGGLGGSGRHFGGGSSPGASLGDRGQGGRGAGPTALRSAQQKANAAAIADEMRKAGAPDEGQAAVLGSMQTESGFNPRAHNDVGGGHTGLWQWDMRRWPKVRAWIEKQGGDPWDARWQAKAYIAEGRAKPGDDIYDNAETSAGFRDVMGSKGNLPSAVHGVQRSERFGIGEEGGRSANASRWLGHLPGAPEPTAQAPVPAGTSASAVTDAEVYAARQRLAAGGRDPKDIATRDRYMREQNAPVPHASAENPIKVEVTKQPLDAAHQKLADAMKADADRRHHINEMIVGHAKAGTLHGFLTRHHPRPLGDTPHLRAAISHSVRGDYNRHGDTFNVHAASAEVGLDAAHRLSARRESQDRIRYMEGSVG